MQRQFNPTKKRFPFQNQKHQIILLLQQLTVQMKFHSKLFENLLRGCKKVSVMRGENGIRRREKDQTKLAIERH